MSLPGNIFALVADDDESSMSPRMLQAKHKSSSSGERTDDAVNDGVAPVPDTENASAVQQQYLD